MDDATKKKVIAGILAGGVLAVIWLCYWMMSSPDVPEEYTVEALRVMLKETTPETPAATASIPASSASQVAQSQSKSPQQKKKQLLAISQLGAKRDEQSMPVMMDLLNHPDPQVRGRAGAAVQNIMRTDYRFKSNGSPETRKEQIKIIRRDWANYLRRPDR